MTRMLVSLKSDCDLVTVEYITTNEFSLFATVVYDYSLPHEEGYFTFQFLCSHGV